MRILEIAECTQCFNMIVYRNSSGEERRWCSVKNQWIVGYGQPLPSWCPLPTIAEFVLSRFKLASDKERP